MSLLRVVLFGLCAAVLAFVIPDSAAAQGCVTWACCPRTQYSFAPTRINWTHTLRKSTTGNFAGDGLWTGGLTASTYDEGWRAWNNMNPANPTIIIESGTGSTPDGFWGTADNEVIHRHSNWAGLGTALSWTIWPAT